MTIPPTSVYLYYDARGSLIYVGITGKGSGRQAQHNKFSEWWPYVARQEVEHYATRDEAALRELFLIRDHRPPFNRQHNPQWETLRAAYLTLYRHTAVVIPEPRKPAAEACGHCSACQFNSAYPDEDPSLCHMLRESSDVDPDEDPPDACPRCGQTRCLYQFGLTDGLTDSQMYHFDHGAAHGTRETEKRLRPERRASDALLWVIDYAWRFNRPNSQPVNIVWDDVEPSRAVLAEALRMDSRDPWATPSGKAPF